MNERIVYEDETKIEEVYTGTYILDGLRKTEEEQRQEIFDMMRKDGITIENENEYSIGYTGADDNDGLSDTQSTSFVVTRTYKNQVPYRVTTEELYTGTYILDGLRKTEEEQKQEIFDMMRKDGVEVGNEEELVIGYTGADDNDGLSDTQSTTFVVSRVKKEKVDETEIKKVVSRDKDNLNNTNEDDSLISEDDKIKELYDELVSLREKVIATDSMEEISNLSKRIKEVTSILDEVLDNSSKNYSAFEEALSDIDKEIFALEELMNENIMKYQELFEEMKDITKEQNIALTSNDLETQEESDKVNNEFLDKKNSSNDQSLRIKKMIDRQRKELAHLVKMREKINNDLVVARALGIPAADFIDITDKLDRRDIIDGIVSSRGLLEIINKNFKNRTDDEKKALKNAKEEIFKEVQKVRQANEIDSILQSVEALYTDDKKVELDGRRRALLLKSDSLAVINDNVKDLPEKIVKNDETTNNYVPSAAPSDMEEVLDKLKNDNEIIEDREEVYSGELIIGEEDIYDVILRNHGVDIRNDDSYIIGYEGASDNDGISESQTTKYVVYKKKDKDLVLTKDEKKDLVPVIDRENAIDVHYTEIDDNDKKVESHEELNNDKLEINIPIVEESIENTGGLVDKYVIYSDGKSRKLYAKKPVFERFNAERIGNGVRIDGILCYEIAKEDVDYIFGNANNSYSPYQVLVEDTEVLEENKVVEEVVEDEAIASRGLTDKYVIYSDGKSHKLYAKSPVFERFNAERLGEGVRIDGVLCYEIDRENVDYIVGNANNSYSPYYVVVDDRDLSLENNNVKVEYVDDNKSNDNSTDWKSVSKDLEDMAIADSLEEKITSMNFDTNNQGLMDKFVIYSDENGKLYVKKPVFNRFNLDALGDGVRINGVLCYEVSRDDADYIVGNANNSYSPYVVSLERVNINDLNENFEDVYKPASTDSDSTLKDDDVVDEEVVHNPDINPTNFVPPTSEEPPKTDSDIPSSLSSEDMGHGVQEEIITLYRDIANNNQVYASGEVLHKFGITPSSQGIEIEGQPCYKISKDTDQIINSIAKMSRDPKIVVKYKNIALEKETVIPRPHVEEIIDKLTDGLDIRAKDNKRFTASNLKIAKGFKNELSSGNVAYNIVHVVPATIKAGVSLIRKLTGKLMTTKRAREAMSTIQERLDNLSEIELEVLFDEYKGSQLKTDMNNQINPLILDRLREYGLNKVARLNEEIKVNYTLLFTILGQVRAIEEQLDSDELSQSEREILENQRKQLISSASESIRVIIESRNKANNLLSSGVHGIEEDFKAVATKLNYVGMRFSKSNDFDNELQHRLGNYGRNLNVALSANNNEAIVQNFMGLESCYYENTEIRGSIVGRRSIGSKYYSPVAEQFDYRDDPFMRDLLTTVAITSATISAINAARVHQIEQQEIINEQQAQASHVNAQNDSTMDYVRQTGQDIAGKRDTFREGMESQANQDVLNNANVVERATLDSHNWRFGDAYHAADDAGHAMYNQFSVDVTSKINDVSSQYASGAITSSEALERMAQISSDAQETLVDTVESSLDIIRDYAASHPQFDLKAVEDSMNYIVSHPGAIANMNQAMADVTNLAEGLTSLQATHMAALTSLPSDMASTIVCAASSALLAMNVSNAMNSQYGKKKGYGDEITDMMDEYLHDRYEEDDEYEDEEEYDDEEDLGRHR